MSETTCTQCSLLFENDEQLQREDNGERVCPGCSVLLDAKDQS